MYHKIFCLTHSSHRQHPVLKSCTGCTEWNSTVSGVVPPTVIAGVELASVPSASENNVHNDGGRLEVIGFVDEEESTEYENEDIV